MSLSIVALVADSGAETFSTWKRAGQYKTGEGAMFIELARTPDETRRDERKQFLWPFESIGLTRNQAI